MKAYRVVVTFKEFGLVEPTPGDFAAGLFLDMTSYKDGMGKYFAQDGIEIEFIEIED